MTRRDLAILGLCWLALALLLAGGCTVLSIDLDGDGRAEAWYGSLLTDRALQDATLSTPAGWRVDLGASASEERGTDALGAVAEGAVRGVVR